MKHQTKTVAVKGTRKDRPLNKSFDDSEKKEIKRWVKERTAMLNKYSVEELKKFAEKYDLGIPKDEEVLEIALRKMCIADTKVFPAVKKKAKEWLQKNGYREEICFY